MMRRDKERRLSQQKQIKNWVQPLAVASVSDSARVEDDAMRQTSESESGIGVQQHAVGLEANK